MSRAEVVNRHVQPGAAQPLERCPGVRRVFHGDGLGDLHRQAFRADAVAADAGFDLFDEVVLSQLMA